MSARDELQRGLQKFLDPTQLAAAMRLVTEATNEAFASGKAVGFREGRDAEREFHLATHQMTDALLTEGRSCRG